MSVLPPSGRPSGHRLPSGPCSRRQVVEPQGDHQREKLEFALAVALTRGDQQRSAILREQIHALGGNSEEPGT
ncbi:MAG: hypothetical protein ACKOPN_08330 [Prochlorococcaceae cyanobacterium]